MKTGERPPDAVLIEQSRKGDEQAFRMLVDRYEALVRSTVVGMLGRQPEAEDVAQEVFIRFFRALADFRGESELGTYLVRIAINLSLNELKRGQRQVKRLQLWRQNQKDHTTVNDPEQADLRDLLRQAITRLEPEFREVVVLRLINGYSVRETATLLNIPEGTVASRLSRAQQRLQAILRAGGIGNRN